MASKNGAKGERGIKQVRPGDKKKSIPPTWEVRVQVTHPKTKKAVRKAKYIQGNLTEARRTREKLRLELMDELESSTEILQAGEATIDDGVPMKTFREYTKPWFEVRKAKGKYRDRTEEKRTIMLEALYEVVGDIPMDEFTGDVVDRCLVDIKDGKSACGGTYLKEHYTLLRQIFKSAVRSGLITSNPTDQVEAPKEDKPKIHPLSKEDSQRLVNDLYEFKTEMADSRMGIESRRKARGDDSQPVYLRGLNKLGMVSAILMALLMGLRHGETLALRWKDVDFEKRKVHVEHSISKDGELADTKTEHSVRYVSYNRFMEAHLEEWKQLQRQELALMGIEQCATTPVCCNTMGGFIRPGNLGRWWRNFRKQHHFGKTTIHDLRHTHATQLIHEGVDLRTIQHRLGHANPRITLSLYIHSLPNDDEKAAEKAEELLIPEGFRPRSEDPTLPLVA